MRLDHSGHIIQALLQLGYVPGGDAGKQLAGNIAQLVRMRGNLAGRVEAQRYGDIRVNEGRKL